MYALVLFSLLFTAAPTLGSILLAANSADFRRVAEKVLPKPMAEKITNYLKTVSLTNGRVRADDLSRYLKDLQVMDTGLPPKSIVDGGLTYRQDPSSFINLEPSSSIKDMFSAFTGIVSNLFDKDGERKGSDEIDSSDEDRERNKKKRYESRERMRDRDRERNIESRENSGERDRDRNSQKDREKERDRETPKREERDKKSEDNSLDDLFKLFKKKHESRYKEPKRTTTVKLKKKKEVRTTPGDSDEDDKRFTRIYEEDGERHYSKNKHESREVTKNKHLKDIKSNKHKKRKSTTKPTIGYDSDTEILEAFTTTTTKHKKRKSTTKPTIGYDADTEILESFTPFQSKFGNDENSDHSKEISKKKKNRHEKKEGGLKSIGRNKEKKTRFQIADRSRTDTEDIESKDFDYDNAQRRVVEDSDEIGNRYIKIEWEDKTETEKAEKESTKQTMDENTNDVIGDTIKGLLNIVGVEKADNETKKEESKEIVTKIYEPVNKIIGTKVPKRPRFTMSTPDYYNKQENVAVTVDDKEPIPEQDRQEEMFPPDRPYLTGIINGKKQKLQHSLTSKETTKHKEKYSSEEKPALKIKK